MCSHLKLLKGFLLIHLKIKRPEIAYCLPSLKPPNTPKTKSTLSKPALYKSIQLLAFFQNPLTLIKELRFDQYYRESTKKKPRKPL